MKLRKPEYWRQKEAGAEKGASFRLGYQHGRKEVLEEMEKKVEESDTTEEFDFKEPIYRGYTTADITGYQIVKKRREMTAGQYKDQILNIIKGMNEN